MFKDFILRIYLNEDFGDFALDMIRDRIQKAIINETHMIETYDFDREGYNDGFIGEYMVHASIDYVNFCWLKHDLIVGYGIDDFRYEVDCEWDLPEHELRGWAQ